jgi:hypothetical protein
MRTPIIALAATLAVAGCGSSSSKSTPPPAPQRVAVKALDSGYMIHGLGVVKPGYVTFDVTNAGKKTHGAGIVRLDHATAAQAEKLIRADAPPPKHPPVTLLADIPSLNPGQHWEGAVKLTPGKYLILDDGNFGAKLNQTFTVAGTASAAAAPRTVGTITMRDFAYGVDLPANWNGKGFVKFPNAGKQFHEFTLIKGTGAQEHKLAAVLMKGYPKGQPKGVQIDFELGGTSPGQAPYVDFDLKPGKYLAVCLIPDAKTMKPHTALGMISTLTVH